MIYFPEKEGYDVMAKSGLGARVESARKTKRWTQDDLAGATGIGIATVRRVELGYPIDPRLSTIQRLADELGVSVGWLLGESQDLVT